MRSALVASQWYLPSVVTRLFGCSGLDIARAPQGWKVAACAEKNQVVLIHAEAVGEPANHVASVGYPAPTSLSRQCRIALGLTEEEAGYVQVLDDTTNNPTTETVAVESPSYIAESVSGQPSQSGRSPQWFIARECGPRVRETVMTPEQIPVVCPQRDGPQALYSNGEVWRGR